MDKLRIKLNGSGVRQLLRSREMMSICTTAANAAQSRLGDGYEVTNYVGKNRVNSSIEAVSQKARKENAESNTILKALR